MMDYPTIGFAIELTILIVTGIVYYIEFPLYYFLSGFISICLMYALIKWLMVTGPVIR